jgi:hypothetical protein
MRALRWIVVVAAFAVMLYMCALPGDLPAETDTGVGLAGTYSTNGVDPSGAEFGGTAVITGTDDPDGYELQLIITGSIQQGRAVRSGDTLRVTWETIAVAGDPLTGTAEYVIGADGVLTGTWRVDGSSTDGTIELFPDP